jgi:alpha-L-fucosidase
MSHSRRRLAVPLTRRSFLTAAGSLAATAVPGIRAWAAPRAPRPVPSPAQLAWQKDELAIFVHFGINTFTDREWGTGTEDPKLFAPGRLDTRQWTRTARAAGFKAMILTAKHHDGFCLWPTKTTAHSVASSPWRDGRGDLVREFVDACRADGLKPGLYLSPWDRHEPSYGDSPRYNDLYVEQLTELLTQYGPIHEVWFDGANGEGPNGKRQQYDWPRVWGTVRRLQPGAVMFSDAGPDVRWIGNERGVAGETNWSTVDPAVVPFPGATGDAVMHMLQHGDPDGSVWRPGETDVSIRPGWFYHAAQDTRVRSVNDLVDIFCSSVGRNSKLLLNVPPTPEGLFHDTDVQRLLGMRAAVDALFTTKLVPLGVATWHERSPRSGQIEIDLGRPVTARVADLREPIERGQYVSRYLLQGLTPDGWQPLARGTTIGYRKINRFDPIQVSRLRLTVDLVEPTGFGVGVGLY